MATETGVKQKKRTTMRLFGAELSPTNPDAQTLREQTALAVARGGRPDASNSHVKPDPD